MVNENLTHVVAIVDRSGSMQTIRDDTIGGFNAFIDKQKTQPGDCMVSLYQFDDHYDVVYTSRPIEQVPGLVLEPRGSTALLDAIGRTISGTRSHLASLPEPEKPGTVVVVIMTDGMENASQEYTYAAIRQLIEAQEKADGWTFLFMGADQDAIKTGASLGVAPARSISYSRAKTGSVWDSAAESIGRLKSARSAGLPPQAAQAAAAFTDAERSDAAE